MNFLGPPAPLAAYLLTLDGIMDVIRRPPDRLSLADFMGYDAHAAKTPWPTSLRSAIRRSVERDRAFVTCAREWYSTLAGEVRHA